MLDSLFLLLFLYLAFIAENQARAVKIHGFVMGTLKFALVVVVFLGIATGWLLAIVLI